MTTPNEPPAPTGWQWTTTTTPAITLRAYIATAALQGLLADPNQQTRVNVIQKYCEASVKYADALIAELAKESK